MNYNFLLLEKKYYSLKAINIYNSLGCLYTYDKKFSYKSINVIICRLSYQLDKNFLKNFNSLKYIISPTTGLTHIDIEYCQKNFIKIISLKELRKKIQNIKSTAELTLALIFALNRKILFANNYTKKNLIFNRDLFISNNIEGQTIGLIGLGRIGKMVAKFSNAIGLKIIYYDKCPIKTSKKYKKKSLKYIFKNADIISLHINYTKNNYKFINNKLLMLCKKNCLIVNTSRGEIIDQEVLLKQIVNKKIGGYAADVISKENNINSLKKFITKVKNLDNIIITPHIGGFTKESLNYTEELIAKYFKNKFIK